MSKNLFLPFLFSRFCLKTRFVGYSMPNFSLINAQFLVINSQIMPKNSLFSLSKPLFNWFDEIGKTYKNSFKDIKKTAFLNNEKIGMVKLMI